ncbi:MAG: glycine cleavage system protein T [Lentisphaerae bacterium GWF2_45_14]|nr:MAG: glycine cleavage system protein T [Lentisphaerae bacterium GWF2_45_14]
MEELRSTPIANEHVKLGARMVPFAGWNMPVQYAEGILAEHAHTREKVSLFDICHMGEFRVKGKDSAEALDGILARPVRDQKTGVCRYNFLLNEKGTVIDDLLVYRITEDEFFIVVNAGTRDGDAAQFRRHLPSGCTFTDESDETAKFDIQGPLSVEVIEKLGFKRETLPGYFKWIKGRIGSVDCLLSRTGYTGELGFEIYVPADKAVDIWNIIMAQENVKPAGLGARDTLRLEMGYALYGHELNLETTPVEAGYGKMLKLESGRKFIGSEVLVSSPAKKQLVAIELDGRRAAREGSIVRIDGKEAGKVSSGAFGPSLGKAVAMAYIYSGFPSSAGTRVSLDAGKASIDGVIGELPFYKNGTARKNI